MHCIVVHRGRDCIQGRGGGQVKELRTFFPPPSRAFCALPRSSDPPPPVVNQRWSRKTRDGRRGKGRKFPNASFFREETGDVCRERLSFNSRAPPVLRGRPFAKEECPILYAMAHFTLWDSDILSLANKQLWLSVASSSLLWK